MLLAKTIPQIRSQLKIEKQLGKKIAFVPTMGALHEGHLALVKKASELAEIVVVSIFVNKAQFDDLGDYQKYPKQVEQDLELLKNSGATHVFVPESSEIFADDFAFKLLPTKLTNCLCGSARVGHFDGVALIVSKLFNIVKPDIAVFGEKDFQQVSIIKKLVEDFNFEVEIFSHEIVREKSGLAMSSRNQRLSEGCKLKAAEIFKTLLEIKSAVKNNPKNAEEILQKNAQKLLQNGFEKIDYLEIRDEKNLEKISQNFDFKTPVRIFIAVYLSGVRLIDNMAL
ncbi:MAG: pantoate--beta-alanine ligase [Rickettsiales bacterium]|nr:pantoate--beta-alanine ligase [Rickettsiales bacterium]